MVKRFTKGNFYTLCLVNIENEDIITWCENVIFKRRIDKILEFSYSNGYFTVDLETRIVTKVEIQCVPVYKDVHYSDEECDEIETTTFSTLSNIVKGWQF